VDFLCILGGYAFTSIVKDETTRIVVLMRRPAEAEKPFTKSVVEGSPQSFAESMATNLTSFLPRFTTKQVS